jgi:hypothetical protein
MKGVLACLLSLALIVTCFGLVGAKADETEQKVTVTLKSEGNSDETIEVTIPAGETAKQIDLPAFPKSWEVPESKVFEGWLKGSESSVLTGKLEVTGDVTLTAKYKDAPKVTFTVKTVYDTEPKLYTYSKFLYKANETVTLEEIFGEAKLDNKTIEYPSAWILNGDPVITVPEGKGAISFVNKNSFKVTTALTDDATVVINLAPAKLNISFNVTVNGKEYSSTFSVENGAKAKTKISYYDIAAGLKRSENEELIALEGKVVTKVGGVAQAGKYSASAYEVANNEIKTADFTDVAIEVADAFTDKSGYDPATDSIFFESPVEVTVYWADVKKAAGGTFNAKNFKSLDLKKENNATTYTGSISLTDKSAGLKVGENKATYLYASIVEPESGKVKYTPNFIVDATPYKKIAVTLAYAQADAKAEGCAIATITTTDTKGKSVVYSGYYDAEKNPENYLYKIVETKVTYSDILKSLQYSTDGNAWFDVTAEPEEVNGKTVKRALDLDKLYELVNGGSKTTLYFRISGGAAVAAVEDNPATADKDESVAAKNAYRATKALKFVVNAAKETKTVKVNVSTGTLALKNGYDYFITTDKTATPIASEAITILPYNKDGKATKVVGEGDAAEEVATTIATADFTPVKKAKENDKMFTSTKVKSVLISDLVENPLESDMYIWIRKSATANKPADKWVLITVAKVTAAPTITNVKGKEYYSVQDVADTKGVVAAPEVKNASSDKNSGAYEYLIVDAADYTAEDGLKVDLSTAKWNTLGEKGVTIGKEKSKYSNAADKKATAHVLKEGSIILIRRAGDKSSNILASDFALTTIVKEEVDVEVEKDGKKTTEKKSLYVWKAYTPVSS